MVTRLLWWCGDDNDDVMMRVAAAAETGGGGGERRVEESGCRDRRDPLMGRIFGVGRKSPSEKFSGGGGVDWGDGDEVCIWWCGNDNERNYDEVAAAAEPGRERWGKARWRRDWVKGMRDPMMGRILVLDGENSPGKLFWRPIRWWPAGGGQDMGGK
ncbi:hypothetical protein Tco_0790189 [Tanacetum coccineum]